MAHDVLAINPGQREGRFILQVSFGFRVVDEPEVAVPSGNDPHATRRYEVASPVSNGGTRWSSHNDGSRVLLGVRASVYGIPGSRSKQRLLEGLDQRRNPRVHNVSGCGSTSLPEECVGDFGMGATLEKMTPGNWTLTIEAYIRSMYREGSSVSGEYARPSIYIAVC